MGSNRVRVGDFAGMVVERATTGKWVVVFRDSRQPTIPRMMSADDREQRDFAQRLRAALAAGRLIGVYRAGITTQQLLDDLHEEGIR